MIKENRLILIESKPETVFTFINTMPNKFPIYKILESKPFLFLRLLLVDGFHTAKRAMNYEQNCQSLILKVGDAYGPFTLTEHLFPSKYCFTLTSFFFNCKTGYTLIRENKENRNITTLNFSLLAENPSFKEKIWWILIKPIHALFANKVLSNIKKRAEL